MPSGNKTINIPALKKGVLRTRPYISLRTLSHDEAMVTLSGAVAPMNNGMILVVMNNELKLFGVNLHNAKLGPVVDVVKYILANVNANGYDKLAFVDYAEEFSLGKTGDVFIGSTLVAKVIRENNEVVVLDLEFDKEIFTHSDQSKKVMEHAIRTKFLMH